MKSRLVWEKDGERTFVVVLDSGEEAAAALKGFADEAGLNGASLTAIGGFERAVVGWFDFARKEYRPNAVDEQCEVLSVMGDVAEGDDGAASVHMHAVLGLSDGTTRGGHLLSGVVHPTLEVTIVESPAHLRRKKRPGLGCALIDLS